MDNNVLDEREERAKHGLESWLKLKSVLEFSWMSETNDPPDIWLKLPGTVYGVEFTSIHGNARNGMPGNTVIDSLSRIGDEIYKGVKGLLVKSATPLKHYYILTLGPDWTGARINRKNVKKYFVEAISAHYIGFVSGEHDGDTRLLEIKESHNMLSGIGFSCIGPNDLDEACWEPNIITFVEPFGRQAEMGDGQTPVLVSDVVNEKAKKMYRNHCPKPWILVIEDNYSWGQDSFEKHLPESSKEFAAIFRSTKHGITLEYGSLQ